MCKGAMAAHAPAGVNDVPVPFTATVTDVLVVGKHEAIITCSSTEVRVRVACCGSYGTRRSPGTGTFGCCCCCCYCWQSAAALALSPL